MCILRHACNQASQLEQTFTSPVSLGDRTAATAAYCRQAAVCLSTLRVTELISCSLGQLKRVERMGHRREHGGSCTVLWKQAISYQLQTVFRYLEFYPHIRKYIPTVMKDCVNSYSSLI